MNEQPALEERLGVPLHIAQSMSELRPGESGDWQEEFGTAWHASRLPSGTLAVKRVTTWLIVTPFESHEQHTENGPAGCPRCSLLRSGGLTLEAAAVVERELRGCDAERCRWPFGSHAPSCSSERQEDRP